jgi:CheY-like chemotaxis protein
MKLLDMTESLLAASLPSGEQADVAAQLSRWCQLVQQIGLETAEPLTRALERVLTLAATGSIDREGLNALQREIEMARQAGMASQRLARLAQGQVRQAHEKLQLVPAVHEVLDLRRDEIRQRGLTIKETLRPSEVIVDATLLHGLLLSLVDWLLDTAQGAVDLRIEVKSWPVRARLICRFAGRGAHLDDGAHADSAALDNLTWRVLEQTAWAMGLVLERSVNGRRIQLGVEFPRTVNNELSGMSALELDHGFGRTPHGGKALAGTRVLVVASRRDVRVQIREALRNMGLIVDFATSVDEAIEACAHETPNAVIVESVLRDPNFDAMADQLAADHPESVFIEIMEEGTVFEISGFSGTGFARVGRDAILDSLPSALLFELSKNA